MPGTATPIVVLHEDDDLVAVSKPAGLPVVPAASGPGDACLHHRLEAERGERLWVVHRLDRDASGVVIFARTPAAHRASCLAFEQGTVLKTYTAYAVGTLPGEGGRIDIPLHSARRGKARPAVPGEPGLREATTDFVVERRWKVGGLVVSRLRVHPRTGRHHQIRVHLRALGAPLLFDRRYSAGTPREAFARAPCERLALHASELALPRPSGVTLVVEAPLAADLAALEVWLESAGHA
jgi:tRNA pseudouridine32 synthase/23S rRNA pseudouridine746 synthase